MIAFGVPIPEPEPYLQYAKPGIELAAEPDSEVFAFSSVGTFGRSYNVLMDAAAAHDDLEALVLLHTFTELADPDLCTTIRRAFADPTVASRVAPGPGGCARSPGGRAPSSAGDVILGYIDHGGGQTTRVPVA